jgi:hypothetical protein
LLLSACNPDFDSFAKVCRERAHIVVHDQEGWEDYLRALLADQQKSGGRVTNSYFVPFPVNGFSEKTDREIGRAQVRKRTPYRNDIYPSRNGKAVATITNYDLDWQGPDASQKASCWREHPEVYGIRADAPALEAPR